MTYIDDPSTKRGIALKRRKEKADLDNLIIEHYRAIEEIPKVSNVFYEWINFKFEYGEISPQSKTRYENDFARFFSNDNLICNKNFSEITALDLEMFIKGNIKKHHLTKKTYGGLKILIRGIFKYARKKKLTDIVISIFFDELELSKNIFTATEKKSDDEEVYNEEEIPLVKDYLLKKDSIRYLGVLLVFVTGMRVGELAALKPEDEEVYNEEEIPLVKDYLLKKDSIRYLGVLLVFVTGMRVGELAALKPEDIQLSTKGSFIHVRRTEIHYSEINAQGQRKNVVAIQNFAKTDAGNRHIILNNFAVHILQRIQELNSTPNEFLFEENGKRIKIKGFSEALKRTCKKLDIPFRPMHKIRKTYGTTLLDNQVAETLVANQMGHSDIITTKKYYYRNNKTTEHRQAEIERALSTI